MSIAYFDSAGELLFIAEQEGMVPPADCAFIAQMEGRPDPNMIYWDVAAGAVTEKAQFEPVITRNTVANIPAGTTLLCAEAEIVVDDGDVEFIADVEGMTPIFLMHPHYVMASFEVPTGPE